MLPVWKNTALEQKRKKIFFPFFSSSWQQIIG